LNSENASISLMETEAFRCWGHGGGTGCPCDKRGEPAGIGLRSGSRGLVRGNSPAGNA
jgi:hypothetical protein